jgi:hypothetical protein
MLRWVFADSRAKNAARRYRLRKPCTGGAARTTREHSCATGIGFAIRMEMAMQMNKIESAKLRKEMVANDIFGRGVRSRKVLYAMSSVHREAFVWFDETTAVTPRKTTQLKCVPDTYPFGL